jgi:hypothetical protein
MMEKVQVPGVRSQGRRSWKIEEVDDERRIEHDSQANGTGECAD